MASNPNFKLGVDYYMDGGLLVLTEHYIAKSRRVCCGNGCRHCPFEPRNERGGTKLKKND